MRRNWIGLLPLMSVWAVIGCQEGQERAKDQDWPVTELGLIKVEEPLAPDEALSALDPEGRETSLSKQYVAVPGAPNPGMIAYKGDYIVINLIDRVMIVDLSVEGPEPIPPGFRLDTHLSNYNAIGSVIDGPRNYFIVSPLGEGDVPVTLFAGSVISDVWGALDYASAQFDEPGLRWVGASYATTQTTDLGYLNGDRRTFSLRRPFNGDSLLALGGGGRLAALGGKEWGDTPPYIVFDPVTRREAPIKVRSSNEGPLPIWVDQGHVLAQKNGKILDFGRLRTVPNVRASEDASRLSPWSAVRSDDKKTLTVTSIYKGGPTYTLRRPGRVWSQNTCFYGLHALYDQGDFYDLRYGTRALSITFEPGDGGEFLIKTASGRVSGSEKMLKKHGLLEKADSTKTAALLQDLLQVRTPQAETVYQRQIQRRADAWSSAYD